MAAAAPAALGAAPAAAAAAPGPAAAGGAGGAPAPLTAAAAAAEAAEARQALRDAIEARATVATQAALAKAAEDAARAAALAAAREAAERARIEFEDLTRAAEGAGGNPRAPAAVASSATSMLANNFGYYGKKIWDATIAAAGRGRIILGMIIARATAQAVPIADRTFGDVLAMYNDGRIRYEPSSAVSVGREKARTDARFATLASAAAATSKLKYILQKKVLNSLQDFERASSLQAGHANIAALTEDDIDKQYEIYMRSRCYYEIIKCVNSIFRYYLQRKLEAGNSTGSVARIHSRIILSGEVLPELTNLKAFNTLDNTFAALYPETIDKYGFAPNANPMAPLKKIGRLQELYGAKISQFRERLEAALQLLHVPIQTIFLPIQDIRQIINTIPIINPADDTERIELPADIIGRIRGISSTAAAAAAGGGAGGAAAAAAGGGASALLMSDCRTGAAAIHKIIIDEGDSITSASDALRLDPGAVFTADIGMLSSPTAAAAAAGSGGGGGAGAGASAAESEESTDAERSNALINLLALFSAGERCSLGAGAGAGWGDYNSEEEDDDSIGGAGGAAVAAGRAAGPPAGKRAAKSAGNSAPMRRNITREATAASGGGGGGAAAAAALLASSSGAGGERAPNAAAAGSAANAGGGSGGADVGGKRKIAKVKGGARRTLRRRLRHHKTRRHAHKHRSHKAKTHHRSRARKTRRHH